MEDSYEPRTRTHPLDKRSKGRSMDIRFGTLNAQSVSSVGSLMTVSRELSKYRLALVGAQEVSWKGIGNEPAGQYTFFYRKRNKNH
jgi:hypothetical protein